MKHLLFALGLWACAPSIVAQNVRMDVRVNGDPAVQREATAQVQRLARVLGFERWLLIVQLDTLPGDVIARMLPRPEYRAAVIVLDLPHFTQRRQDLCETAAHELLHIKLLPLRQALLSLIAPEDSVTRRQAADLEESVVSDMARLKLWKCP